MLTVQFFFCCCCYCCCFKSNSSSRTAGKPPLIIPCLTAVISLYPESLPCFKAPGISCSISVRVDWSGFAHSCWLAFSGSAFEWIPPLRTGKNKRVELSEGVSRRHGNAWKATHITSGYNNSVTAAESQRQLRQSESTSSLRVNSVI